MQTYLNQRTSPVTQAKSVAQETPQPTPATADFGLLSMDRIAASLPPTLQLMRPPHLSEAVIQRALLTTGFNLAGEKHNESGPRRHDEVAFMRAEGNTGGYWSEPSYQPGRTFADPPQLRAKYMVSLAHESLQDSLSILTAEIDDEALDLELANFGDVEQDTDDLSHSGSLDEEVELEPEPNDPLGYGMEMTYYTDMIAAVVENLEKALVEIKRIDVIVGPLLRNQGAILDTIDKANTFSAALPNAYAHGGGHANKAASDFEDFLKAMKILEFLYKGLNSLDVRAERSLEMHSHSNAAMTKGDKGLWKVGDDHITDIKGNTPGEWGGVTYNLITRAQFNVAYQHWLSNR